MFSISSGLEFWSVKHFSMYGQCEFNAFKNINFYLKYLTVGYRIGANVYKTLES